MLQPIGVTLYELFGYVIPGAILVLALAIVLATAIAPSAPLAWVAVPNQLCVVLLFVAYISGHVAQALGNVLARLTSPPEDRLSGEQDDPVLPKDLLAAARSRAAAVARVDPQTLTPQSFYAICDETVVQRGSVSNREIYIYREGFYRGLTVSFLLLAVALLFRASVPGAAVKLGGAIYATAPPVWVACSLTSLAASFLMFGRYRRFAAYRVTRAVIAFLALKEKEKQGT